MICDVFVCNRQHFLPKGVKAAVNPQFKENLEVHGNMIIVSLSDRRMLFQEQMKRPTSKSQPLAAIPLFSFNTKHYNLILFWLKWLTDPSAQTQLRRACVYIYIIL